MSILSRYRIMPTFVSACRLLFAVLLLVIAPATAGATGCHALLIGISNYSLLDRQRPCFPDGQPIVVFLPIHCDQDVKSIAVALKTRFNFSDSDIKTITEANATRQNILNAFDELISETQPGDIVYIHYSGHGSQVADPTEPNGLDSTIVPIDYAISASGAGLTGLTEQSTHEISGKTIRAKLEELESKDHPKQVILSFDCCNSGLATRGAGAVNRGKTYAQISDMLSQHGAEPLPIPTAKVGAARTRGPSSTSVFDDLAHSNYVVFEACRSDEEDQEATANGTPIGPLSYCLSRAFETAEQGVSYRQIFDQVQAEFLADYPSQHPQLDGSNPGAGLFGDIPTSTPRSIPVAVSADKTKCVLLAGMFQDVTVGSLFAIYKKGSATFDATDKIATATVKTVSDTSSILSPIVPTDQGTFKLDDMSGAEAVELVHNFNGKAPLTVDAASIRQGAPTQADAILAAVRALKCATVTYPQGATPDVRLIATGANGQTATGLALARGGPAGAVYRQLDMSADIAAQVSADLQEISRYRTALTLAPPASSRADMINVDIKIVPAITQTDSDGFLHWKSDAPIPATGLKVGDIYTIQVRNSGSESAHVAILDMDSNAEVSLDWPPSNYTLQDNVVAAHSDWVRLWNIDLATNEPKLFKFDSPDDTEIFKAVATEGYVDLRLLGRGGRDASNPLSALLSGDLVSRSSSAVATAPAPATWSARSTTVHVAAAP